VTPPRLFVEAASFDTMLTAGGYRRYEYDRPVVDTGGPPEHDATSGTRGSRKCALPRRPPHRVEQKARGEVRHPAPGDALRREKDAASAGWRRRTTARRIWPRRAHVERGRAASSDAVLTV
jgi:hypothetical protein